MAKGMQRVAVSQLPTDRVCSSRIFDDLGRVLVNEGTTFTTHIRDGLLNRGITEVFIRAVEGSRESSRRNKQNSNDTYVPVRSLQRDWTGKPYDNERRSRFGVELADLNHSLGQAFARQYDVIQETDRISEIPETLVTIALEDQDLAIAASSGDWKQGSFLDRSILRASLSMAIGIELGHIMDEVVDLGKVSLLHDWGISQLPEPLRRNNAELSDNELWEYRKHPVITARLLQPCVRISSRVMTAITQIHERPDGTGFPLGLRGARISPLARIVATADMFLELISPGRGRGPFVPHDAAILMRRLAESDKLDSTTVDALIKRLSIFPIGTRVTLDDGLEATVIRRAGDSITLPTVQLIGIKSDMNPIVALHETETRIVEVSGSRISRQLLNELVCGQDALASAQAT